MKAKTVKVERAAYVCRYCDGVYADEPVSQCDCMGASGKTGPHFLLGKLVYRRPERDVPDCDFEAAEKLEADETW